jgi:hypothetical protein
VFYDPNDPEKGGEAPGAAKGGYQKERSMPSKSPEQAALMRAVAHGWKPSRMKGPSRRVAKEFAAADKKVKRFQYGGLYSSPEDMTFMDEAEGNWLRGTYPTYQPPQVTQPTAPTTSLYGSPAPSGEPEGGSFYEEDPGAPYFPDAPVGPALPPVTTPTEDTILGGGGGSGLTNQEAPPPMMPPPMPPQAPVGSRSYALPSRYSEQAAAHQARIRAMTGAGGAARGGPVRMQGGGRIPQRPGGLGQVAQRPRAPGVGTRPPMPPRGQPQGARGPGGPGGPGGVGMRGGAPPSMRGHLQAMRAQQRQAPGGNRIGMGDQQGGLARAMQTQTGRPPISRRAAFPGSRQNQF